MYYIKRDEENVVCKALSNYKTTQNGGILYTLNSYLHQNVELSDILMDYSFTALGVITRLIYLFIYSTGAVIVTANMNDIASLEKALDGANAMFLTTHYWEDKTKEKEIVKVLPRQK